MVKMGSGKVCVLVVAALGLSGCGTSGSVPQDGIDVGMEDVPEAPKSHAGLLADALALFPVLAATNLPINMPADGSASFEGIGGLAEPEDEDPRLLSEIVLTANFADATLAGQLFNFVMAEGAPITGTLDVENGVIAGPFLNFDIGGSLTRDGKVAVIEGKGQGAFRGDGLGGVLGSLSGTSKEGVQPAVDLDGFFVGTKTP
jgi:hypothetical protein